MIRKVYISSTYKDLIPYRDAIRAMFSTVSLRDDYTALGMEDYVARDGMSAIQVCLEDVRNADIYILILSKNYGSIVEDTGRSYTETEYVAAKEVQASRTKPYAVFVFSSNDEFEQHDFKERRDLQNDQLKEFYDNAKRQNAGFIYPFTSPDSLCNQILLTL